MPRHLSGRTPQSLRWILALTVVLALIGTVAVAQAVNPRTELEAGLVDLDQAQALYAQGETERASAEAHFRAALAALPTSTTSTTLPPTTSSTTSTTQPPTTSTSTTQPPTTTSTPATGQPTCAGAGLSNPGALVVSTGTVTITTSGAIVENREIRGQLVIDATNVTVRNVWVWVGNTTQTVWVKKSGAVFDHVEVGKQGTPGARGIAAYSSNAIIRDSYIHDVEDGIKMGSNSTYTGNRIQLLDSPNPSPHSDAIQADGGQSNVVITNNCLDSRTRGGGLGNAALQIDTSLGGIDNFRMEGNLLNGGNYTVFWRIEPPNGAPTNGILRNNWFGCQSRYGTVSSDGNLTRSGNRWASGCQNAGQLIPGG